MIVLPGAEIEHLERTVLQDYYFLWGADEKDAAILLGALLAVQPLVPAERRLSPRAPRPAPSGSWPCATSPRARRSPPTTTATPDNLKPCGSTLGPDRPAAASGRTHAIR